MKPTRAPARKGGGVFWGLRSVTRLQASPDEPVHKFVMIQDITEQKEAEDKIRFQAELLESVEQGVIAVGANQDMKDVADAGQHAAATLHGSDGVVEARHRRIGRNGGDLGLMLGERIRVGGAEMFRADAVERRHAVRRVPIGQHGILGRVGSGHGRVLANAAGAVIYVMQPRASTR